MLKTFHHSSLVTFNNCHLLFFMFYGSPNYKTRLFAPACPLFVFDSFYNYTHSIEIQELRPLPHSSLFCIRRKKNFSDSSTSNAVFFSSYSSYFHFTTPEAKHTIKQQKNCIKFTSKKHYWVGDFPFVLDSSLPHMFSVFCVFATLFCLFTICVQMSMCALE